MVNRQGKTEEKYVYLTDFYWDLAVGLKIC
jgi:hypothetical protein